MSHQTTLLRLALPNYAALLSSVIAGIIDVAWVAKLGPDAVSAVALGTNVENFLLGVILLASGGTTITLSRYLGAGDQAGARAATRAGWTVFAAITPVVAIGGFLARQPITTFFLNENDAAHLAVAFLAISLPTTAILYAQHLVDATFAGRGDTRTPMRLALLTNATLLVLDPMLIHGWLSAPRLGVQGAATATALARLLALAIGLHLLRRHHTPGPAAPLRPAIRQVLASGAPIAGDFVVRMAGALALVEVVGGFGVVPLAAYGIGTKALYLATMAFYALRNAAVIHTPRVLASREQYHDRSHNQHVLERQTLQLATIAGLGASLFFAILAPWIIRVFTMEPEVVAAGASFLRWVTGYLVPIAAVIALNGVLIGSRRGRRVFTITVAGTCAQTVAAWVLAAAIGLTGVWLAMAAAAVLQLALLFVTRD